MTRRAPERILAALAPAWLAAVAAVALTGAPGPEAVAASPDRLAAGALWRLPASALVVAGGLPLLQVAVLAAVTAVVLARAGAATWWAAALAGHVGSTLLAYGLIGVAAALGSDSADRAAGNPDYGISCVLAALLGVLCAQGVRRRSALDAVVLAGTALAVAFWVATLDWYGIEHLLALAIGAGVGARSSR